jgi:glycosyltransferase involved in cell wall biosynthesis
MNAAGPGTGTACAHPMPGRKRILFLVPAFKEGIGGVERVILTLLRQLDHTRYECHLALAQSGQTYLEDMPACVTVHQLQVSRMRYALPAILRLAWKLRPHTILATVSYLNVMLAAARPFLPRGARLLLREATTPSAFIQKETRHPKLWTWFYRRLYPRAEKIICLSDAMLEDMAQHFAIPREKLVRIYNPVDIGALRRLAAEQENPYQGNGPRLLFAGRLQREKGADLLLDAMPAVIQRFPGIHLTILGEGPEGPALRAQATRLGIAQHVDFSGYRECPWSYFSNADLFALPSRNEGLPNALLESLALGTPAVASLCVGAIREILASNPQLVVVPPEDPAALAQGIIAALAANKGRASLEQSMEGLQNFEVKKIAEQYSRLF